MQSTYRRTWRADPKLRASEPKKRLWALWRPRKVRKTLEKFSFLWQNCKITEVLSTFVKKNKIYQLELLNKAFFITGLVLLSFWILSRSCLSRLDHEKSTGHFHGFHGGFPFLHCHSFSLCFRYLIVMSLKYLFKRNQRMLHFGEIHPMTNWN